MLQTMLRCPLSTVTLTSANDSVGMIREAMGCRNGGLSGFRRPDPAMVWMKGELTLENEPVDITYVRRLVPSRNNPRMSISGLASWSRRGRQC